MKSFLPPFMLALILAGCGDSVASLATFNPAPAGVTLRGTLAEDAQGSVVRAYRIGPGGVIGGGGDSARSYPLPPPDPVAVSSPSGQNGEFQMVLPDRGPFLLKASGGQYRDRVSGTVRPLEGEDALSAAIAEAPPGSIELTPWSTAAARLALARSRHGQGVEQSILDANRELANHFALSDLLSPAGAEDRTDLRLLSGAVEQMARDQGLEPDSLRRAIAGDLSDGRFDGLEAGQPVPVLKDTVVAAQQTDPGTANLSPSAGTTDLAAAVSAYGTSSGEGSPSSALQASLQSSDGAVGAPPSTYVSPYSVNFSYSLESLTAGFADSPRNDFTLESSFPSFANWYTVASYPAGELPWGPLPATYPAPTIPIGVDSVLWQRERVVATGLRYIGYDYQHHHIPDWNPEPYSWPAWTPVMVGHNGAGIDCSDFSSWNYNYGLGLKLITAVATQAASTEIGSVQAQTIAQVASSAPADYNTLVSSLETGDLLYIRGQSTAAPGSGVTHVIMWLGDIGQGPDSTPLILDSHDNQPLVSDANGNVIPPGVHIRPFIEGSWYHRAFDHAHRIIY